jgi:hypothetical protein
MAGPIVDANLGGHIFQALGQIALECAEQLRRTPDQKS